MATFVSSSPDERGFVDSGPALSPLYHQQTHQEQQQEEEGQHQEQHHHYPPPQLDTNRASPPEATTLLNSPPPPASSAVLEPVGSSPAVPSDRTPPRFSKKYPQLPSLLPPHGNGPNSTSDETEETLDQLETDHQFPPLPTISDQHPTPSPSKGRSQSLAYTPAPIKRKPLSSSASPLATRYSSPGRNYLDIIRDLPRPESRFSRSCSLDSPTLYEFPTKFGPPLNPSRPSVAVHASDLPANPEHNSNSQRS